MEKIYLKEEISDYLRSLEYERAGYDVLLKEFLEETEEDLNINSENFSILLDRYKEAYMKCRAAVEEVIGFPVTSYYIDFNKMELDYEK